MFWFQSRLAKLSALIVAAIAHQWMTPVCNRAVRIWWPSQPCWILSLTYSFRPQGKGKCKAPVPSNVSKTSKSLFQLPITIVITTYHLIIQLSSPSSYSPPFLFFEICATSRNVTPPRESAGGVTWRYMFPRRALMVASLWSLLRFSLGWASKATSEALAMTGDFCFDVATLNINSAKCRG